MAVTTPTSTARHTVLPPARTAECWPTDHCPLPSASYPHVPDFIVEEQHVGIFNACALGQAPEVCDLATGVDLLLACKVVH